MQAIFDILGKPQGKGRPRFARNGKPYTPAATAEYETRVANLYMNTSGQYFGEKPLRMILNVFYEVPKSTSKKRRQEIFDTGELPAKKPDADNIAKVICDALNGIAYKDDAQIVELQVIKKYTPAQAHVLVYLEDMVNEVQG